MDFFLLISRICDHWICIVRWKRLHVLRRGFVIFKIIDWIKAVNAWVRGAFNIIFQIGVVVTLIVLCCLSRRNKKRQQGCVIIFIFKEIDVAMWAEHILSDNLQLIFRGNSEKRGRKQRKHRQEIQRDKIDKRDKTDSYLWRVSFFNLCLSFSPFSLFCLLP